MSKSGASRSTKAAAAFGSSEVEAMTSGFHDRTYGTGPALHTCFLRRSVGGETRERGTARRPRRTTTERKGGRHATKSSKGKNKMSHEMTDGEATGPRGTDTARGRLKVRGAGRVRECGSATTFRPVSACWTTRQLVQK